MGNRRLLAFTPLLPATKVSQNYDATSGSSVAWALGAGLPGVRENSRAVEVADCCTGDYRGADRYPCRADVVADCCTDDHRGADRYHCLWSRCGRIRWIRPWTWQQLGWLRSAPYGSMRR